MLVFVFENTQNSFSYSPPFHLFRCTDSDSPLYFLQSYEDTLRLLKIQTFSSLRGAKKRKALDLGLHYYHTHYISDNRKNKSTQNICCACENFKLQLRANCTDSVGTSPVILQTFVCFPLLPR